MTEAIFSRRSDAKGRPPPSHLLTSSALEEIRTPNLLIRGSKCVYKRVIASIYQRCPVMLVNWPDVGNKLTSNNHY
jgi:hypothetical protein